MFRTLEEIKSDYIAITEKLRKEYEESMNEELKSRELNGNVIRKSDGQVGVILIERNGYGLSQYSFRSLMNDGRVSSFSSGIITDLNEYAPYTNGGVI